jgi:hypothetical protein
MVEAKGGMVCIYVEDGESRLSAAGCRRQTCDDGLAPDGGDILHYGGIDGRSDKYLSSCLHTRDGFMKSGCDFQSMRTRFCLLMLGESAMDVAGAQCPIRYSIVVLGDRA